MKHTIAAALLAVATPAFAAPDGFTFGKAEYDRSAIEVEFVVFRTAGELQAEAERLGAWTGEGKAIRAFSAIRPGGGKCTIYMLDPKFDYMPQYIGHELMHCKYGRWHK